VPRRHAPPLPLPQAARAFPDVDRPIAALDLEEDAQEPALELDDWQARGAAAAAHHASVVASRRPPQRAPAARACALTRNPRARRMLLAGGAPARGARCRAAQDQRASPRTCAHAHTLSALVVRVLRAVVRWRWQRARLAHARRLAAVAAAR
jgi:hypothetical protein